MFISIVAPHFVAGVELGLTKEGSSEPGIDHTGVVRCAPILSYMRGWSKEKVLGYAKKKNWETAVMEENEGNL